MAVEAGARIPPEWRPAEKYIATCARCGREVLKANAVALYRKRPRGNAALLMHLCEICWCNFLDDYGMGE